MHQFDWQLHGSLSLRIFARLNNCDKGKHLKVVSNENGGGKEDGKTNGTVSDYADRHSFSFCTFSFCLKTYPVSAKTTKLEDDLLNNRK